MSACSLLVPGCLPEAVAGWEPAERAVGSGSLQTDRCWTRGLPQGSAGEWQEADSCRYAVGEEKRQRQGEVSCRRYVRGEPKMAKIISEVCFFI